MLALNKEVTIPLKYLSNFLRSLDLLWINCEVELGLLRTKNCVLVGHHNNITGVNFMIASTKLYVPTYLSKNDNIKFLKNIKQGFKRTICWKKYSSEVTTQPKNNILDYMIVPTFSSKRLNHFLINP